MGSRSPVAGVTVARAERWPGPPPLLQPCDALDHVLVRPAAVMHAAHAIVGYLVAIETDGDVKAMVTEETGIFGLDQRRVRRQRETHLPTRPARRFDGIGRDRADELAVDQRLAADGAEHEIGARLRTGDEAVHRRGRQP